MGPEFMGSKIISFFQEYKNDLSDMNNWMTLVIASPLGCSVLRLCGFAVLLLCW
jgi:hypothetical protein